VETGQTRLKALKSEENRVRRAIVAIKDSALHEIEIMGNQTQQHMAGLLDAANQHGRLQREAAQLEEYIALARAFSSRDPGDWAEVPQSVVQQLLMGLVRWAGADGHNRQVAAPQFISQRMPALRLSKRLTGKSWSKRSKHPAG